MTGKTDQLNFADTSRTFRPPFDSSFEAEEPSFPEALPLKVVDKGTALDAITAFAAGEAPTWQLQGPTLAIYRPRARS